MAETTSTNSQYTTSYSTFIQYMDLTATVWPLDTTSGLGATGNGDIRHRLTSKSTVTFRSGPEEANSGLLKLLPVGRLPFPV